MDALPVAPMRRLAHLQSRILEVLCLLLACFASAPAEAGPALDPARHPYIALISTDQARYDPGAQAHVLLSLRNPSDADFAGRVTTTLFRNEHQILQDSRAVSMPPGGHAALAIAMAVPPSDVRGYRVEVMVDDPKGEPVDSGFGSLDVEAGALPPRFPRQCWVSKWGPDVDAEALAVSLVAWRCNIVQGYANYYRPEVAPPVTLQAWPSLPNKPVGRPVIAAVIAAAHARRLPVLFFQATGEAYDDFLQRGTGPTLEEGSFVRPCSKAAPCGEADLDRSPRAPDNWSQYGWQTDHLDLFDTCSHGWQKQLLVQKHQANACPVRHSMAGRPTRSAPRMAIATTIGVGCTIPAPVCRGSPAKRRKCSVRRSWSTMSVVGTVISPRSRAPSR